MFIKRKFKIPMIMLLVAIFSLSTLTNAINAKGPGTGITSNKAPVITQGDTLDSTPINKGETAIITLNATDPDKDTLYWDLPKSPSNGTVSISIPVVNKGTSKVTVTYTPSPGYSGSDSFNVLVYDNKGGTDSITINVSVNNRAPFITQGDTLDTSPINKDETATITLNATDADNDTLLWSITSPAANGTVSISSPPSGDTSTATVTYTPDLGYYGSDSFNVQVSDSSGGTDSITINVSVNNNNRAPVITQGDILDSPPINKDVTTTITLNATDADNDALSWSINSPAANGTATISSPSSGDTSTATVTYTPKLEYYGSDSFNVQVSDSNGGTDIITINISVNNNNRAPVVTQGDTLDSPPINKDETATITLNATDADNDALSWGITCKAANGIASISYPSSGDTSTATVTYTPKQGYYGSDSFNVQVSDANGATDSITINVSVNNNNRAPVITQGDTLNNPPINKDETATIALNATDADNDNLSWSIFSSAINGTVSILPPSSTDTSTATVTYKPNAGFYGLDSFKVQVADYYGATDIVTINVSVNNRAPAITQGDTLDVPPINKDETATITLNATDADNDILSWSIPIQAVNGTASISAPSSAETSTVTVKYTPKVGFTSSDTFKIQVTDSSGAKDIITINIQVIKNVFTIYAITDTHISINDGKYIVGSVERLRRLKSFVNIANTDQPDLVLHTGDAVSTTVDWNSFIPAWNNITPSKIFVAGNHDFDDGGTFETIAAKFGYTDRTAIGGSKFNYTQTIAFGNIRFLLISLDTNVNYSSKLDQARLDWVSSLLQNTTCSLALIISHASPYYYKDGHFDQNSALALNSIVQNALSTNPNLKKVQSINGHMHPTSTILDTTTFGPNFPGLILKGNVGTTGNYTKITIDEQYIISWEDKIL